MNRLLTICFGVALLFVSLYPVLAAQIYTESWYKIGCAWHGRCQQLGEARADRAIAELARFWRHQGDLSRIWTAKERRHLADVRPMFDAFSGVFVGSLVVCWMLFSRERLRRAALVNAVAVLLPLIVLPFFKYFWVEIFHPVLFDDLNWQNTRSDLSWYLMPKPLFALSLGVLVTWTCVVNLAAYWWARSSGDRRVRGA